MKATSERPWERHIVVHASVDHPADAVFPYLADPTKWHDFAPVVEFREQVGWLPIWGWRLMLVAAESRAAAEG